MGTPQQQRKIAMRFSLRLTRRSGVRFEIRKSSLSLEIFPGLDVFIQFGKPSLTIAHNRYPASNGRHTGELFIFGQYVPYEFSKWSLAAPKANPSKPAGNVHANL